MRSREGARRPRHAPRTQQQAPAVGVQPRGGEAAPTREAHAARPPRPSSIGHLPEAQRTAPERELAARAPPDMRGARSSRAPAVGVQPAEAKPPRPEKRTQRSLRGPRASVAFRRRSTATDGEGAHATQLCPKLAFARGEPHMEASCSCDAVAACPCADRAASSTDGRQRERRRRQRPAAPGRPAQRFARTQAQEASDTLAVTCDPETRRKARDKKTRREPRRSAK